MKQMWAPWRSAYILGQEEREKGCILCNRATCPEEEHEEQGVLYQSKHAYVMLNRYPYTGGHLMVVPNRHTADLNGLTRDEYVALSLLVRIATTKLGEAFHPQGFNIGMNLGRVAGAGIDEHLHMHIVPRFNGDTNFFPVMTDTRVIHQSLKDLYKTLAPLFADVTVD